MIFPFYENWMSNLLLYHTPTNSQKFLRHTRKSLMWIHICISFKMSQHFWWRWKGCWFWEKKASEWWWQWKRHEKCYLLREKIRKHETVMKKLKLPFALSSSHNRWLIIYNYEWFFVIVFLLLFHLLNSHSKTNSFLRFLSFEVGRMKNDWLYRTFKHTHDDY